MPSRLRRLSHQTSDPSATAPTAMRARHGPSAFLPHEDPEHDAAHPDRREDRADDVDSPVPGVRDVVDELAAHEHDRDDHDLSAERDPPGEVRRDEASEQRPDGGCDRRRGSDERVGLSLHRALEVAVDQGLHRGSSSAAPRPPTIAQKITIASRLCASVIASAPTA